MVKKKLPLMKKALEMRLVLRLVPPTLKLALMNSLPVVVAHLVNPSATAINLVSATMAHLYGEAAVLVPLANRLVPLSTAVKQL
jgi:hypothetical protein